MRVIENEFASQSIDTEQLANHQAEVKTIAGVCICCSTGRELTVALEELAETSDKPVIVEATGVANSLVLVEKLAAAGLLEYYDLQHAIFILDAAETLHRPELLDTYWEELAAADLALLSKTDLLEPDGVVELMRRLSERRGGRIESMLHGEIDPSIIQQPSGIVQYYLDHEAVSREHERELSYTIIPTNYESIAPSELQALWPRFIKKYSAERMKGAIYFEGEVWHVEATPSQCQIVRSEDVDETRSLVIIGAEAHYITEDVFMREMQI